MMHGVSFVHISSWEKNYNILRAADEYSQMATQNMLKTTLIFYDIASRIWILAKAIFG